MCNQNLKWIISLFLEMLKREIKMLNERAEQYEDKEAKTKQ